MFFSEIENTVPQSLNEPMSLLYQNDPTLTFYSFFGALTCLAVLTMINYTA